jgi:8-hydroxy-5-deazaflavin:NADPH oxidoreductase
MTTAIIGVGNIGGALARHLVRGGEQVALAAREEPNAVALAGELGPLTSAAPVPEAIKAADVVVFAVWFDPLKQLMAEYAGLLDGKVMADPSNPLGFTADDTLFRTLPEGQSQGSLVAAMLPAGAHYVKAFGTLSAPSLAGSANRTPRRAVLFYATDDDRGDRAAHHRRGVRPGQGRRVSDAGRIEMPGGDLHEAELGGKLLDADQARAAVTAA